MIKFLGVTGIITTSLTLSLLAAPPANAVECFLPNCYAAITVTGADAKHHIWAYRAFNYPSSKAALDASLTGCFKLPNGLYYSLMPKRLGWGASQWRTTARPEKGRQKTSHSKMRGEMAAPHGSQPATPGVRLRGEK